VEQPLPAERKRAIRKLLRERQVVRVSRLSEALGVSEVTIRRDLEELEQQGVLERTHGGAILAQRTSLEPAYTDAVSRNPMQKRQIGEAAAALVQPGETIFLNGGTTTMQVFRHLSAPGIRVVTNHVGMALESAERDMQFLLLGGNYRSRSNSCVGPTTTEGARRVFAARSFIGLEGLSPRSGLTSAALEEADIARVMIEQTEGEVVAVADASKVGTVADFQIVPLERARTLATDDAVDDEVRQELEELGLRVIVAGVGAPLRGG
jgi:DeoR family fructose operon transcriptional repressor